MTKKRIASSHPRPRRLSPAMRKRIEAKLLRGLERRLRELHLYETRKRRMSPKDFSDAAPVNARKEILERYTGGEAEVIRAIQGALKQLREGTYGTCVECQQPIPAKRLLALPFAQRCVRCKTRYEGCR